MERQDPPPSEPQATTDWTTGWSAHEVWRQHVLLPRLRKLSESGATAMSTSPPASAKITPLKAASRPKAQP
jgi:hypothetical protein